jgi:hypothetical protein
MARRRLYRSAVELWKTLSPQQKQEWQTEVERVHLSGFNLFLSEQLSIDVWVIGQGAIGKARIA